MLLCFKSPETIANYLSILKTVCELAHWDPVVLTVPLVKRLMMGCKRLMVHETRQAWPLTPQLLRQISLLVDQNDHTQVIAFAALFLGFYLFLRRSNLVSENQAGTNFHGLHKCDVQLSTNAALISVTWSKTVQFRERILQLPLL